jgi:hypothetical protein
MSAGHCVAKLGANSFMVAGVEQGTDAEFVYHFDMTEKVWTKMTGSGEVKDAFK